MSPSGNSTSPAMYISGTPIHGLTRIARSARCVLIARRAGLPVPSPKVCDDPSGPVTVSVPERNIRAIELRNNQFIAHRSYIGRRR